MKPTARSCGTKRLRVADQHDRQTVGLDVLPGDALDVVRRDRLHALAERADLLERQLVEHRVEHDGRDVVRRLDGQREAAGQIGLRVGQLALEDTLPLQLARTPRPSAAALRRSSRSACSVSATKSPACFIACVSAEAP